MRLFVHIDPLAEEGGKIIGLLRDEPMGQGFSMIVKRLFASVLTFPSFTPSRANVEMVFHHHHWQRPEMGLVQAVLLQFSVESFDRKSSRPPSSTQGSRYPVGSSLV